MTKEALEVFQRIVAAKGTIPDEWVETASDLQGNILNAVRLGLLPESLAAVTDEIRHGVLQYDRNKKGNVLLTYTRNPKNETGMLMGDNSVTLLGPKQTPVFEHFLTHPSELVTGEELRRIGDIASPTALHNLMNGLRLKLHDDEKLPHVIHSLRRGWMYTPYPHLSLKSAPDVTK